MKDMICQDLYVGDSVVYVTTNAKKYNGVLSVIRSFDLVNNKVEVELGLCRCCKKYSTDTIFVSPCDIIKE